MSEYSDMNWPPNPSIASGQMSVPHISYGGELGGQALREQDQKLAASMGIIGGGQAYQKSEQPSIMQILSRQDQEIKVLKEVVAQTRQEIEFLRARLGI